MSEEFKAWLREICERHRDALEEIGWVEKKKPPYVPVEMRTLVEVVRCEECKHRDKYECNHIMLGGTKCGVTDDWFCADGERRSDE